MLQLDTERLVERRLHLGLSRIELGAQLGVTSAVIARLEAGRHHGERTLDFVGRLASALGLSYEELLCLPAPPEGRSPSADGMKVEAALLHVGGLVHQDVLAAGLGWDLPRVRSALNELGGNLRGRGVHLQPGSWGRQGLQPTPGVLTSEEQGALDGARHHEAGLTVRQARLLQTVARGATTESWFRNLSRPDRVNLAVLLRLGLAAWRDGAVVPGPDLVIARCVVASSKQQRSRASDSDEGLRIAPPATSCGDGNRRRGDHAYTRDRIELGE